MTASPIAGIVEPGFETVRDAFDKNFSDGEELGAGFAVIKDGDVVVNLIGGWADRKKEAHWTNETLVPVYSTTKGIAALVLAHLVERLPAGFETAVADIWPEFSANGKGDLTIGQVASHQAGLPGFPDEIDPELWLDPPSCAAALAELTPMWPPGSAHGYHPLSWGYLVGEIARRISGETLGTTLRSLFPNIDFMIGTPASEHDRCADIQRPRALADLGEITPARRAAFVSKWSAPNRGGAIWREIEIPSANGHGTALSVAQLYETYTKGGGAVDECDDIRCPLLGADSWARSRPPHDHELRRGHHAQHAWPVWARTHHARSLRLGWLNGHCGPAQRINLRLCDEPSVQHPCR